MTETADKMLTNRTVFMYFNVQLEDNNSKISISFIRTKRKDGVMRGKCRNWGTSSSSWGSSFLNQLPEFVYYYNVKKILELNLFLIWMNFC